MKKLTPLFFTLLISACFQAEPPSDSKAKQSAIEVKSQTQAIDLAPLGQSLEQSLDQPLNQAFDEGGFSAGMPIVRPAAMLYGAKISNAQVEDVGVVAKILPDDKKGSRHQKFLVKVPSGQTLLFAHNIDLAPRIDNLKIGDTIEFRGEYEYNPKGGLVHWTHHDPQEKHFAGWIKLNGKVYE